MEQQAAEQINCILELLRNCLIQNGVSIGFTEDNELMFFDTDTYLADEMFFGFTVPIEKLVR